MGLKNDGSHILLNVSMSLIFGHFTPFLKGKLMWPAWIADKVRVDKGKLWPMKFFAL